MDEWIKLSVIAQPNSNLALVVATSQMPCGVLIGRGIDRFNRSWPPPRGNQLLLITERFDLYGFAWYQEYKFQRSSSQSRHESDQRCDTELGLHWNTDSYRSFTSLIWILNLVNARRTVRIRRKMKIRGKFCASQAPTSEPVQAALYRSMYQ